MTGLTEEFDVRRQYLLFTLIFVIGIALRVVMLLHLTVVSPDSPGYIYNAETIGTQGVKSLFTKGFGGNFSIYPLFIYLANLVVGDLVLSGQLVSLLFGSLLLVPAYLIAREMMGTRVGLVTAFLVAVHPHLIRYSGEVLKDSTLGFFAVGSAALALFGCTRRNRLLIVLAGVSAWTTAVVRLYGIIVVPCLAAAVTAYTLSQKEGLRETLVRLLLLLFPLPIIGYIAFLTCVGPQSEFLMRSFIRAIGSLPGILHEIQTYPDILMANNPQINQSYLEVITGYPHTAAAAHFLAVFTTAFLVPFFLFLVFGLYIDRQNLLRKGPRLFILSFSLAYILFDLAIVMILFFIGKRQLMPLVTLLLPWSAWAIYALMVRFNNLALTRSGIGRRLLSSVIPLSVVIWVVFAFSYAGSTTWENAKLEYKKSAGECVKEAGGDRLLILAPVSDTLVTFYAGGEGVYFADPGDVEKMIAKTRPDFILWDTDLGPLPEEFRRLTEAKRIEPVRTVPGTKDNAIHIYRSTMK